MQTRSLRPILVWLLPVLMCSCIVAPKRIRPLPLSPFAQAQVPQARACQNPANPDSLELDELNEFKYGCFCGKDFPAFDPAGKDHTQRIADYYTIQPKDDVDRACRDHDVCWMTYSDGDASCNDDFTAQLTYLKSEFEYSALRHTFTFDASREKLRRLYEKCEALSRLIEVTFQTLFVQHQRDGRPADIPTRTLVTPLAVTGGGARLLQLKLSGGFPDRFERCVLEEESITE